MEIRGRKREENGLAGEEESLEEAGTMEKKVERKRNKRKEETVVGPMLAAHCRSNRSTWSI